MANPCYTTLSVQSKNEITDKKADALFEDIKENYDYEGNAEQTHQDENLIEIETTTRWNVQTELLQELAKKHAVNIRAVGREDGAGFVQVVCVDDKGEIVQDEEISYYQF